MSYFQLERARSISGHVFRVDRAAGPVWYAKYRLPDGRQVQKKVAPAWTRPGRPDDGFVNRRGAEAWLADVLAQAHAGTLPGMVRTGVTFERASSEWLRYCVEDRACKPSTMVDYRHTVERVLVPVFGPLLLDDITAPAIEAWRASLSTSARTRNKQLTILNGIFRRGQKRFGLQRNPVLEIERMREPRQVNLDVFSPEEVMALVRAAESEQDAAIYLTAAFTGLRRGELIALRWRDVDFAGCVIRVRASYAAGALTTPKSGKLRSVPMAPQVAEALARLGRAATDDALVFLGEGGGYLDGSALRRRYKLALERAGLRSLRFHDLRHTFGTRAIAKADILRVKEWMGHADVATTMRYLHYVPRPEDARLIAAAFEIAPPTVLAPSSMPDWSTQGGPGHRGEAA
ncbi:MAG: site-specific integrase [Conexibacter sp.]|nr:site-specific integrase [Conexibacter sp.]